MKQACLTTSMRYASGLQVEEKCHHPSTDLNKRYDNPSLTSWVGLLPDTKEELLM